MGWKYLDSPLNTIFPPVHPLCSIHCSVVNNSEQIRIRADQKSLHTNQMSRPRSPWQHFWPILQPTTRGKMFGCFALGISCVVHLYIPSVALNTLFFFKTKLQRSVSPQSLKRLSSYFEVHDLLFHRECDQTIVCVYIWCLYNISLQCSKAA